ncbi:hypothetical protein FG167_09845 [Lacinutrix sp. WUR7]|uniref:hypothetical protein n=1 Tax=Lacinutrix sp. WUR7 TaxID=2653681 RepID=UPI00193E9B77|nr:hypothetical protein [Lacinutrix sp. WUR7]QRM89519.1 hypothetical protein FG167_09845 [Lacinutrix sp. WUR7]
MNEQTINKGFLIAGGLLGLGLLSYLFFREKEETTVDAEFTIVEDTKPNKTERTVAVKKAIPIVKLKPIVSAQKETKVVAIDTKVLTEPNDDFPLKLGSKGKRVEQLQVYLLKNYGAAGIVTDEFNAITNERVLKFLKVDKITEQLFEERDIANLKNKDARKKKY